MYSAIFKLAEIYRDLGRNVDASQLCDEGVSVARQLAGNDESYLGAALQSSAASKTSLKEYDDAERLFNESLEIYDRLPVAKINENLPDLLVTQWGLADLYRNMQRKTESLQAYQKALVSARRLAGIDPSSFAPDVRKIEANIRELNSGTNQKRNKK